MLLPTWEIVEFMIFIFYIAYIRKKIIWAPGPTKGDNFKIFSPVTIKGLYSNISQSFMLLPTREIGELVIFIFYISHIRKNRVFGPRATKSVNFKFFFCLLSSWQSTQQLSKVLCFYFYLHGKSRISDESLFNSKKTTIGPPAPMSVICKTLLLQLSSRECTQQVPKVSC